LEDRDEGVRDQEPSKPIGAWLPLPRSGLVQQLLIDRVVSLPPTYRPYLLAYLSAACAAALGRTSALLQLYSGLLRSCTFPSSRMAVCQPDSSARRDRRSSRV